MKAYHEHFENQVRELKTDPNVDRVYEGKMKRTVPVYRVFDRYGSGVDVIDMEEGDDVFITFDHDGSWFINFPSLYPNTYLYRAAGAGPLADSEDVHVELPLKEL